MYYTMPRRGGSSTTICGKSEEEASRLAGQVLISALAVPVKQKAEEAVEEVNGRTGRFTSLLGLSKTPSRTGLVKDAVSFNGLQHAGAFLTNSCLQLSRNVLKLASEGIRLLYKLLQVAFDPLTLIVLHYRQSAFPSSAIYRPEQIEVYIMHDTTLASFTYAYITRLVLLNLWMTLSPASTTPKWPRLPRMASSFNLQLCRVHTRLSGIATALNHTLTILEPPPVSTAEEQCARVATLATAAEAERMALRLRRAIVARQRFSELAARKEKEQSRRTKESRLAKYDESRRAVEDVCKREIERARAEIQ